MRVCVQPNINLMTTGGGSVRFNPNLYNCGKVCLSLLGTWSGSSEEMWNKDSTLLQLFVSIQALIFVKEPYFNEPGVESSMGSASAVHQSRTSTNGGWEPLRVATVRFAMIDMIKNPPAGFEDVVLLHFLHKRRSILDTMARWQAEAEGTADQLRAEVSTCRLLGVVGSP
jgi:baculoviral IAP repeat-containing protein 6